MCIEHLLSTSYSCERTRSNALNPHHDLLKEVLNCSHVNLSR